MSELIRLYGDNALRAVCETVEAFDSEITDIVANLTQTLSETPQGAALAAPQIGSDKKIFVWSEGAVINLKYEPMPGNEMWNYAEGCLSFPDMYWHISRPRHIIATYYNEKGMKQRAILSHFDGRVFQHEQDHLEGILIVDRLTKSHRKAAIKKLAEKGMKE